MKRILAVVLALSLLLSAGIASADEGYEFEEFSIDIIVTEPVVPIVSGGGGGGGTEGGLVYSIETNLFGTEEPCLVGYDGSTSRTVESTSEDGNLSVVIPKGTTILDKKGEPLISLGVTANDNPPAPPADANVIGLAYNFEPSGAIFEPPMTLTWTYDPATLPEGVAEGDLVLAFYDEEAGEWIEMECVVNPDENTITASVSHFTTFAIIGAKTPLAAPVAPVISPEPVSEPSPPVIVAPTPTPPTPEFEPSPPVISPPPITSPPTPIDSSSIPTESRGLPVWGIIVLCAIAVAFAILVYWLMRRVNKSSL